MDVRELQVEPIADPEPAALECPKAVTCKKLACKSSSRHAADWAVLCPCGQERLSAEREKHA